MKRVSVSNDRSFEAVKQLNKLLHAANNAREQGKYLALNKVLGEAQKLSKHIRESQADPFQALSDADHKKALSELQWLRHQGAQKVPPAKKDTEYIRVQGVIVE